MAAIILNNKKFEYDAEIMDLSLFKTLNRDDAEELLLTINDLFEKIGIKLYLMFGTLLGAVRDKDFIKNDYDVDIYITDENKLFENLEFLRDNNFLLIRAIKHKLYSFRYKGGKESYIDIAILNTPLNPWGLYCYCIEGFYIPKSFFGEGEIMFLGKKFHCPSNPERMLEYLYTETWKTPLTKSEKDYYYDVPSYHFYKLYLLQPVKDLVKICLRFILGGKYKKYRNKYRGHED